MMIKFILLQSLIRTNKKLPINTCMQEVILICYDYTHTELAGDWLVAYIGEQGSMLTRIALYATFGLKSLSRTIQLSVISL